MLASIVHKFVVVESVWPYKGLRFPVCMGHVLRAESNHVPMVSAELALFKDSYVAEFAYWWFIGIAETITIAFRGTIDFVGEHLETLFRESSMGLSEPFQIVF